MSIVGPRGHQDVQAAEPAPPAPELLAPPSGGPPESSDAAPSRTRRRRPWLRIAAFALLIVGTLTLLIILGHPGRLWARVRHGHASWLLLAAGLEAISLGGYMLAFRVLVASGVRPPRWRFTAEVTLAGVVATKLIAAFGAGGVALNVWALRAAGFSAQEIAVRLVSLLATLYGVFMTVLFVGALGLWAGVLPGPAPTALTVLPGLIALGVVGAGGALLAAPEGVAGTLRRVGRMPGPLAAAARAGAQVVDAGRAGICRAGQTLTHRPQGVLGAVIYWAGDLGTLWASLHAFGHPPAFSGVLVSYFVAQLLGALPVPGGVGVVDGGLAGALIAFGASGTLAVVGVIAYRFISYWLPTVPGALAYASLLRTVDRWRAGDAPDAPGP